VNENALRAWIDSRATVVEEAGSLGRLKLHHVNTADVLQSVGAWEIEPEDETSLSKVKVEIVLAAKNTAAEWKGFNRFALQAYYGPDRVQGGYYPFSVDGTQHEAATPGPTESANLAGMLKQQMRHNEAVIKLLVGERGEQQQLMMRQNQQMATELERTRESHFDLLRRQEETLSQVAERELAIVTVKRSEDRKDALAGRAMETLPIVANRISRKLGGPDLMANATDPAVLMLTSLLKSMDDAQFTQWVALFPDPVQQAQLLELYNTLVREPAKAAAKAATDGGDSSVH
jgi:hypothetical protein